MDPNSRRPAAPQHMPEWSGQNWYLPRTSSATTISVIEKKSLSYDEYADKREREKDAKRLPYGFARALQDTP